MKNSESIFRRRDFITGNWQQDLSINARCLNRHNIYCLGCKDSCERQAIRFSPTTCGLSLPEIVTERCNHCGDCLASCPTGAITVHQGTNTNA